MTPGVDSGGSTPERDGDAPGLPEVPEAPQSWKAVLLGLWIAVMAAALCAVLVANFLHSRPVDLRGHTTQMATELERLLAYNQVPEANIVFEAPTERQDTAARWLHYDYQVEVPSTLSLNGVVRLIRKNMTDDKVSVVDEPGQPAGTVALRLATAGHEFARVLLKGKPDRSDLTEASRQLSRELFALLSSLDPPAAMLERTPPEPRENDEAVWEFTGMKVRLTEPGRATRLVERISEALSRSGVYLKVEAGADDSETRLTVTYNGLPCAGLDISAPPEVKSENLPEPAPGAGREHEKVPGDLEELPLDSEHLNGDARKPVPITRHKKTDTLQVAIIVDDGGYGGAITEEVLALDPALTLSILPNAPHSAETAERAEKLGFQVLLHMPMENSAEHKAFPGQVTVDMNAEEIHRLTDAALEDVPGAMGINNHTGSKFTSDPAAMRAFLEGIQSRKLFFVDSRTISTSKGFDLAQEMKIPSAARDLFLDNESKKSYIREQFRQLIALCKEQGSVIAICHFRRNSVEVLKEMLPKIKEAGITVVHASELIE